MSTKRNNRSNYATGARLYYHTPFGVASERIDTDAYFTWLEDVGNTSFNVEAFPYDYTLRREKRRNQHYWYAYKKFLDVLYKVYVGKSERLTSDRLYKQIPLAIDDKINALTSRDK